MRFVCGWSGETAKYFPLHSHSVIEFVHHPRGSGITTLEDGSQIDFEPGGTVIYPPGLRHDQRMRIRGIDICLHAALAPGSLAELPFFSAALYIPPSGPRGGDSFVRTEFARLARLRPDPDRQVELDFRITALLLRLLHLDHSSSRRRTPTLPEIYLTRARRFIAEHYARITDVGEISRHVGVSEDYLRHLFARQGGTSLNRLLRQTRIERAKELLVHSRLPMKEIAALAGFQTERYLATRFKRATRLTPGEYRQHALAGEIPAHTGEAGPE